MPLDAEEVRRIFDECGTDKGQHGYAPFYASLEPPGRLLEIGVATGSSMMAWRRIWPDVEIWGVDIWPRHLDFWGSRNYRDGATHVIEADATAWDDAPAGLDLIVDDGSHHLPEQVAARERLWQRLRRGGLYVIEDVFPMNLCGLWTPNARMVRTGDGWDDRLVLYFQHA